MLVFRAICTLMRIALLWKTGATQVPPLLCPGIFIIGLWFDVAVLAWPASPILLWQALRRRKIALTPLRKVFHILLCWLAISVLLFSALSEWSFWVEFSTCFNFIAIDYLIYTQEAIATSLSPALLTAAGCAVPIAGDPALED
ncbi:MAG: hypothetical protein WAO76_13130 [Georgfuchsia sp.]